VGCVGCEAVASPDDSCAGFKRPHSPPVTLQHRHSAFPAFAWIFRKTPNNEPLWGTAIFYFLA
jgi:hypothetical protein